MDPIVEQYNQKLSTHLQYIQLVSDACKKRCEQLRDEAEAKIKALNPPSDEATMKIKVELKAKLDQTIQEFVKEMKKSFYNNLEALEEINRQKEKLYLEQIEDLITNL
jgi:DNA anti-recombination protein RmuC